MSMTPEFVSWRDTADLKSARHTRLMRTSFSFLAAATDAAVILLVSVCSGILYHRFALGITGNIGDFVQIGVLAAFIYIIPAVYMSQYAATNYFELRHHPAQIGRLWTLAFACLITIGFLAKSSVAYSRGWMILFFLIGLPALMFAHMLLAHALAAGSQAGLIAGRRLFLIGLAPDIRDFLERQRPWSLGLDIVGIATLTRPATFSNEADAKEFDEALKAAVNRARGLDLDGIFLAAHWSDQELINRCVEAFVTVPTPIHLTPNELFDRFGKVAIVQVGPMVSLHLLQAPHSMTAIVIKRALDIVASATALIMLSPLLLAVAAIIKLDSKGPVFFVQRRHGFNQKQFRIFKFRTMTTLDDGAVIQQAKKNDARFTRIGGFMRRTNIDELPQLINVLLGDMSLVGPRPHALAHDQAWGRTVSLYARRHNVKPGITGWAQVNGYRGIVDTDDRLRGRIACDLYYIDNWSVWLDIKILFATVFGREAYRNAH
jgi:Undecaprenyl-phosphate glucose phosphotransferase